MDDDTEVRFLFRLETPWRENARPTKSFFAPPGLERGMCVFRGETWIVEYADSVDARVATREWWPR